MNGDVANEMTENELQLKSRLSELRSTIRDNSQGNWVKPAADKIDRGSIFRNVLRSLNNKSNQNAGKFYLSELSDDRFAGSSTIQSFDFTPDIQQGLSGRTLKQASGAV